MPMMRAIRLANAFLLAGAAFGAGPAFAAPAAFNWSGLYVGANGGFSGGEFNQTFDYSGDFCCSTNRDHAFSSGFTGGGQVGVNFQSATSNIVAGVEADFDASSIEGTYLDFGPAFHSGTQLNWWGTVRGRLGYAAGRFLPYVTGGVAYGHLTNTYTDTANGNLPPDGYDESWSDTRIGWTIGGGVEAEIAHNVSAKVEYLYTDLGSWRSEDPQNAAAYPGEIHNTVTGGFSTARIGLNWKFN